MPCKHRFVNELIPNWEIQHLLIGTFNPSWNENNAVQADYFYGRIRNNFWCILPKVFGGNNLKYENLATKLQYLKTKKIGITDLISNIQNADDKNVNDIKNLTKGFSYNVLNKYQLEFETENIKKLILQNIKTLKGVYLTRSTLNGINQISENWIEIEKFCAKHSIRTDKLKTPANYGGGCVLKSEDWRTKILL
jgi:G:T/U-mismatch repair DNA glycosylase